MKVSYEQPPVWDQANKLFKLEELKIGAVFTYGDTIYNPSSIALTPELIRHEETHMEQQQANSDVAKAWWKRYIQDPQFRLEQEAEAYAAQYKLFCQIHKDRNKQARYLYQIAGLLASPMYGNIVTRTEAQSMIKEFVEGGYDDSELTTTP